MFMPRPSAQTSSFSICCGSKVSACHISSSLIAFAGRKLLPTSHGWRLYQSFACDSLQRDEFPCAAAETASAMVMIKADMRINVLRTHDGNMRRHLQHQTVRIGVSPEDVF